MILVEYSPAGEPIAEHDVEGPPNLRAPVGTTLRELVSGEVQWIRRRISSLRGWFFFHEGSPAAGDVISMDYWERVGTSPAAEDSALDMSAQHPIEEK